MGSGFQQCMYLIAIIRPCKYCMNIYLNNCRIYLIYYLNVCTNISLSNKFKGQLL